MFYIKFDYGCEFAQHSLTLTHWNINCVGDFTKMTITFQFMDGSKGKEKEIEYVCVYMCKRNGCWTNWPITQGTLW